MIARISLVRPRPGESRLGQKPRVLGMDRRARCQCGAEGEVQRYKADGRRYEWVDGCTCESTRAVMSHYGLG